MSTMRAIIVDPDVQGRLTLHKVESPSPTASEALVRDIERNSGVTKDLERLAQMIAEGRLQPQIGQEASWSDIGEVARRLLGRRIAGKAVLFVS